MMYIYSNILKSFKIVELELIIHSHSRFSWCQVSNTSWGNANPEINRNR